jgi:UDP-N-acetyl-D-mannosaminuronic acid dehydrogenase
MSADDERLMIAREFPDRPAPPQQLCVLGLGYIGLPTAAMFATHGYQVLGVDVDPRVVRRLGAHDFHSHEPGLNTLVQAALKSGNLRVSTTPEPADVFFIAVPTPLRETARDAAASSLVPEHPSHGHHADLSYVSAATESIVPHLRAGSLVVLESTVPPRTTIDVVLPILERSGLRASRVPYRDSRGGGQPTPDLYLAHCPERVLPGRIVEELVSNDRLIGGIDHASAELARSLYVSFVQGDVFLTDATTAEMVKLMENTYRDVNIGLANQFALIAQHIGVDVWEAIDLANHHPRVQVLRPGPGVGGHCIAVDPYFLMEAAPASGAVIPAARELNNQMPRQVVDLVRRVLAGVEQPVVAALGLAYKGNVDDARESPAVVVVQELAGLGYDLRLNDPYVSGAPGVTRPLVSLGEAFAGADCIVVLTDHAAYANLDPAMVAQSVRHRLVVDTRRCLDLAAWRSAGFRAFLLGDGHGLE